MTNKIHFALVLHFHQPVDNFHHVFEEAYDKSYRPFIDLLERYPQIRLTLHYSGSLLEWIETYRPEFLKRLAALVSGRQVEIMSGGFYEPILCVIPRKDCFGQIAFQNAYLREKLGAEPEGMWLTERVWEPHLPSMIHDAGIKYLVVDDTHFRYAGLLPEEMYGYYATEDEGKVVYLFPSSEKLRYTIPFRQPHETVDYLRSVAQGGADRVLVYGDDGEKFGLWPDTYDWVYNQRWLERFFEALTQETSWINVAPLGEILRAAKPLGRIYIPTASYEEMMEWSLPTEAGVQYEAVLREIRESGRKEFFGPYLRGGFWRNFLEKYPEANQMHKKMLWVSRKVSEMAHHLKQTLSPEEIGQAMVRPKRGVPDVLVDAYRELWRGQVNCPYWHGVFGGLYLGHLRAAVYRHLIRAEKTADEVLESKSAWVRVETLDFDCDGHEDLVVTTPETAMIIDLAHGGMITELDYRARDFNLVNTLSRRPEVYHRKLKATGTGGGGSGGEGPKSIHDELRSKEAGLDRYLHYDLYRRGSLVDHLFEPGTTLAGVMTSRYAESASLTTVPYLFNVRDFRQGKGIQLSWSGEVKGRTISVVKEIRIKKGTPDLEVDYRITLQEGEPWEVWFGVEFNFAMLDGLTDACLYYSEDAPIEESRQRSMGETPKVSHFGIKNELISTDFSLDFSRQGTVWRFPVETVSQSEGGLEREYQSSVVIPHWKFSLEPGHEWDVRIGLRFKDLPPGDA